MASKPLRIFISFSHRDDAMFSELYFRLLDQGHHPFTYQTWEGELPPGEDHVERIRHELKSSDWAIFLITRNSLGSEWVACEADCAFESSKVNLILANAIVDRTIPDSCLRFTSTQFPNANLFLKRRVHLKADTTMLDEAVEELFVRLGIEYKTSVRWSSTDLGEFFVRAREEIPKLCFSDSNHAIGIQRQAIEYLDACRTNYGEGSNSDAIELASTLDKLLVDATTDRLGSYNVALVLSSLLSRFGPEPNGTIHSVSKILKRIELHTLADEVVLQSLGYLELSKGNPLASLEFYQKAYAINPDEHDAVHGLALSHLYAERDLPGKLIEKLTSVCETRLESVGVLMLALAKNHDWLQMQSLLRSVLSRCAEMENVESLVSAITIAALEAKSLACQKLANDWICNAAKTFENTGIEARVLAVAGLVAARRKEFDVAIECFARLVDMAPSTIDHLGRYLYLLILTKQPGRSRQIAAQIVGLGSPEVGDKNHYYYRGMAYWVFGLSVEASSDFSKSEFNNAIHYDQIS